MAPSRVSEGLILGTMMVGQAISFAPNYGKALAAAIRIFGIVDRKPKTDHSSSSGLRLVCKATPFLVMPRVNRKS